jgi:hypothetical protein
MRTDLNQSRIFNTKFLIYYFLLLICNHGICLHYNYSRQGSARREELNQPTLPTLHGLAWQAHASLPAHRLNTKSRNELHKKLHLLYNATQ